MDPLPKPPRRACLRHALTLLAAATLAMSAQAAPFRSPAAHHGYTDRVIVKWHSSGVAASHIEDPVARAASLSELSGVKLTALHAIRDRLDVLRLESPQRGEALRQTLARLRNDPAVEYAEADARRYILAFPDDPPDDPRFIAGSDANGEWHGQWYLQAPVSDATHGDTLAAISATSAWKIRSGTPAAPMLGTGVIIAVIDTGVDFTHPDLGVYTPGGTGTLLPGRDFVCNDSRTDCLSTAAGQTFLVANDGDGWDADATDPGDWISAADVTSGNFPGCGDYSDPVGNPDHHIDSSWHGTRVAGIAAAITNNGTGIAGVAPGALILPVRVIGKCGGFISDIVAGMYWAAGLTYSPITGVTTNLNKAQILNLSLGASDSCTQTEQDAVTAINQDGHLIVAASGNDGGPVGAPANCKGVLSVAGLRHVGTKVGYSNVSSTAAAISIGAPAGNCYYQPGNRPWADPNKPCLFSIETTSNAGLTSPTTSTYTYSFLNQASGVNYENEGTLGTSFAAPIVSGVAALMVQANGNLTAGQLIARMQSSATPFPVPATPPTGGVCHVASLTKDANGKFTDVQNADECQCTTATCGAGMVNAAAAVAAALLNASVVTSADKATIGQSVTLDGTGSSAAPGYTIVSYQWSSDPAVSIANANTASASLVFPALRPLTVTLTVTDDAGRQAQASKTISGSESPSSSGSGSVDLAVLACLAGGCLLAITSRRRRQATTV
jgi:serine protease